LVQIASTSPVKPISSPLRSQLRPVPQEHVLGHLLAQRRGAAQALALRARRQRPLDLGEVEPPVVAEPRILGRHHRAGKIGRDLIQIAPLALDRSEPNPFAGQVIAPRRVDHGIGADPQNGRRQRPAEPAQPPLRKAAQGASYRTAPGTARSLGLLALAGVPLGWRHGAPLRSGTYPGLFIRVPDLVCGHGLNC